MAFGFVEQCSFNSLLRCNQTRVKHDLTCAVIVRLNPLGLKQNRLGNMDVTKN